MRHEDFERLLASTNKGDFVYLDPPYAVEDRRVFRQYSPDSFCSEDLSRLGTALSALDKKGVHFVVSYAYCREALKLFSQWKTYKVFTQRNVAGFASNRRLAAELMATNQPMTSFPLN